MPTGTPKGDARFMGPPSALEFTAQGTPGTRQICRFLGERQKGSVSLGGDRDTQPVNLQSLLLCQKTSHCSSLVALILRDSSTPILRAASSGHKKKKKGSTIHVK